MREILFRGMPDDGSDWVFGDLIHRRICKHDIVVIRTEDSGFDNYNEYEVIPKTVGQYAYMTDKKCRQIFTGDIVRDNEGKVYLVEFTMSGFFLKYSSYGYHELVPLRNFWHAHGPIIEVIGNIHDNPELLKESEGGENG